MAADGQTFRKALGDLLAKAEELGFVAVEINSGNLHRLVGGYPGPDHRMSICCEVMYREMKIDDTIIAQPESGKGASVVVRYSLPR
jgi:5-methylcytosine-specific restriction protein A